MAKREEQKSAVERRSLPSKLKKLKKEDDKQRKGSGTKYLTGSSGKVEYGQRMRQLAQEGKDGTGVAYGPNKARKAPKKPSQPKAADTKGITKIGKY